MQRLAFPFSFKDGTLELVSGQEAAGQALQALVAVQPGELPLSRSYGLPFDYHVGLDRVQLAEIELKDSIARWHSDLSLEFVELEYGDDGRLVNIKTNVTVEE